MNEINDSIFQKLMSDPIKRQLILEVINSEKDQIQTYIRKPVNFPSSTESTSKKYHYDSPAALLRQRALQQQNCDSKVVTASPNQISLSSTPVSHNKILEGVIAFVEVKNHDQDRSRGVKALLQTMGTDVRDTFSKDVTHVVFKDGSYKTYQKARLMNVHLVSVLWIEACKLNGIRVAESKFPALGVEAYDHNVSTICSQLQKEYEEIIKDELNKSFTSGKPLPSTKDLIIRRKSSTLNKLSQEYSYLNIKNQPRKTYNKKNKEQQQLLPMSSEISSDDDSDVGAIIDGNHVSKSKDQIILESFVNETCDQSISMEFTNIGNYKYSALENINHDNLTTESSSDSSDEIYSAKTPKLKCLNDRSINTSKNNLYRRRTQPIPNRLDSNLEETTSKEQSNNISPSCLSPLNISDFNHISILSKNMSLSSPKVNQYEHIQMCRKSEDCKQQDKRSKIKTNNNDEKSSSTNMSSLHVSSEGDIENINPNTKNIKLPHKLLTVPSNADEDTSEKSSSLNMSPLYVSSEVNKNNGNIQNEENCKFQLKPSDTLGKTTTDTSSSTNMSALHISSEPTGGNINILNVVHYKPQHKTSILPMNTDTLHKNIVERSTNSNMSSLQISTEVNSNNYSNNNSLNKNVLLNSTNNNMPLISNTKNAESNDVNSLNTSIKNISQQKSPCIEDDFESNSSISPLRPVNLNDIFKTLDSPPSTKRDIYITRRRSKLKFIEKGDQTAYSKDNQSPNMDSQKDKIGGITNDILTIQESKNRKCQTKKCNFQPTENCIFNSTPNNTNRQLRSTKEINDNIESPVKELSDSSCKNTATNKKTQTPKSTIVRRKRSYNKLDKLMDSSNEKLSKCDNHNSHNKVIKKRENNRSEKSRTSLRKKSTLDHNNENMHNLSQTSSLGRQSKLIESSIEGSSNSDSSGEKKKRIRKLYNPNESFSRNSIVDDETERGLRRKKTKVEKSTGVVIFHDIVQTKSHLILTEKTKDFLEKNEIKIDDILNSETNVCTDDIPLTKNKKKKKNDVIQSVDSNRDEQKELAQIILDEQNTMKNIHNCNENKFVSRRSTRLSHKNICVNIAEVESPKRMIKKPLVPHTTGRIRKKSVKKSILVSTSQPNLNISSTSKTRRSTMEFQTNLELNKKRKLKIDRAKESSIVCTKLHTDAVVVFQQIVKKIGGFCIEDEVSDKTTHLVAGEPKRTINMLRALARGCWILKHEWLFKSLEAGKWLPEEDFEETNFSQAVQQCRLQRQAFGVSFSMDIFKDYGQIYVARGSVPRCSDLRELITLCKGNVTNILRNASIIIGGFIQNKQVICLNETWVLDSIQYNKKMKYRNYIIKEDNNVIL